MTTAPAPLPAKKPNRSATAFLKRNLDLWTALGLLALLTVHYLRQPFPLAMDALDDYDVSMFVDLVFKAQHGIWLGKQVLFTSGPLFQWMLEKASGFRGQSLGALYVALFLLQFWISIAALYGAGRLLLAHQAPWKRTFCLLLLVVFWMPVSLIALPSKFLIPLFWFAVFAYLTRDLDFGNRAAAGRGVLFAAAVALSYLFACDAGSYTAVELALVLALRALAPGIARKELRALAKTAAWTAASLVLLVLVINQAFGSPFDFHFWRGIAEVIQAYRWSEAIAMSPDVERGFFVTLMVCLAIFAVAIARQRLAKNVRQWRQTRLWSMLVGALIFVQAGVVVSEIFHVALSLFPLVIMSCYMLFGAAEEAGAAGSAVFPVVLTLTLTGILSGPNHVFIHKDLSNGLRHSATQTPCPAGTEAVDEVCVPPLQAQELRSVSGRLNALSRPEDTVAIFPYQNIYGRLAGRQVAGDVLQNYLVAGDYLNRKQLESWQRARPAFAIYSPDGVSSIPLGGIPNFTRTPQEWLYMQQHYEFQEEPIAGVLLLRRNDERALRWKMQTQTVEPEEKTLPVAHASRMELGDVAAASDADFLRVTLRLDYPAAWKLLKPSFVLFYLNFTDGSEKRVPAMVEPNRDYEVWIYPHEERLLANYFWASSDGWHAAAAPQMTHLDIGVVKMDWASVLPYRVHLHAVDAVRLTLNH